MNFICKEKQINEFTEQAKQYMKQGYWQYTGHENKYACTTCHAETNVDECMGEPQYEYCPYCGAKMYIKEIENEMD